MIKPILIFLVLINYFSFISFSQTLEQKKKTIRKIFQQINKDSTLKSYRLENEEFLEHATDGGGLLIGAFKDTSLVRISGTIGLSFETRIFEYYYKKGKLVFAWITEKQIMYNDTLQDIEKTKMHTIYTGRFYFDNGNLIDSVTKGHSNWNKPNQIIQDIIETSDEFMLQLKKKMKYLTMQESN